MSTESAELVVVAACASFEDCDAVAALCGSSFPEECYSQGLSIQQWAQIEAEDLRNTPSWWRQIGLAREISTGKLLGVVVLTLEHEADDSMSWSEYSRRVGCCPTVLSWMYDQVLDEPLQEHECLIDFIAVSPDARGKGVGGKLMQWAEHTGAAILADADTEAVAAHGVDMTLWVAADNEVAVRLYQRSGYSVVKRTDTGACHCMASQILNWFLGHPVWIKMRKQLPAPEHLTARKPQQQMMPLVVAAGPAACAALTRVSCGTEAPFVDVPLNASMRQPPSMPEDVRRSQQAGVQPSPRSRRARQQRLAKAERAAAASGTPRAGAQDPCTPKIAAVGGSLQAVELAQHAALVRADNCQTGARVRRSSQSKEGQGLQLFAAPSAKDSWPAVAATSEKSVTATPLAQPNSQHQYAQSVASVSVPSASPGDSDDEEDRQPQGVHEAQADLSVFRLVALRSEAEGVPS